MKRCDREAEVVAWARARALDPASNSAFNPELLAHVRGCLSCAETERVVKALLMSGAAMHARQEPPAADQVWRRAQLRRQEIALRRATRPLIIMRVVSFACMAVFAVWVLRFLSAYRAPIEGFGFMATWEGSLGIGFAILCVAVGSLYLWHEGRRGGGMPYSRG